MIAYLDGKLEQIDKASIVVEVAGVGYLVKVSSSTLAQLPKVGDRIKIYTSQIVREDDISLYGFLSKEEKNLFVLLMSVSGVGPKVSMAILSAFPIDKLISAITSANADLIATVQGIGKKTAQKLVIELKEKVAKAYALRAGELNLGAGESNPVLNDAVAALVSLGYSPKEARAAVQKSGSDGDVEAVIKKALANLA